MTDTSPQALRTLAEQLLTKKYTREMWLEPHGGVDVPCDAGDDGDVTESYVNPVGPCAAELLRALAAEKEDRARTLDAELADALKRYEDDFVYLNRKLADARRAALEEAAKVADTALVGRYTNGHDIGTARRYIAAAIRALIDREPEPVVADGWKLVPVEPTPWMLERGWEAHRDSTKPAPFNQLADGFRAMIAAAPKPTEPPK